ncbi:hypothetical protein V1527DRAFT_270325 [Lipomyces starkeyi]
MASQISNYVIAAKAHTNAGACLLRQVILLFSIPVVGHSAMSTNDKPIRNLPEKTSEGDNEPDEWDKRIEDTGCASENMSLTDCYADNGRDWRKCAKEIAALKQCWEQKMNNIRTQLKP